MLNNVLLLSVLATAALAARRSWKDICRSRCPCEEKENALSINCENKGLTGVRAFQAPPHKMGQLFLLLGGNLLARLEPDEFLGYGNVTSLHLGHNGLREIRTGAFNGLRGLRRLHLNNNNLEVLREDTFSGLEGLEYLQADYNYISAVEAGAFGRLSRLKVLILNDNLLPSLPSNVFRFVMLTHLDLRGNRLRALPFAGVLEHVGGVVEIQLDENPWNCTCELLPLRAWLDTVAVLAGDVVCETPFRLHGKDVAQLIKQDLCPRRTVAAGDPGPRAMQPPPPDARHRVPLPTARAPLSPTRAPKASRAPRVRGRPTPRVTSGRDRHVFGPIMVYQTRSPVPVTCPSVCVCTAQGADGGLNVNCQERKLHNVSELQPRPSYPRKLHLTGNYLQVLYREDLGEYATLELLHLGNNRIGVIQDGAFERLTSLRRLYLNGNYIESLSPALFSGLQSLQYLYLEYNVIKDISPPTFSSLHNLQLLFLNNNLLRSLPHDVFGGTMLTRLNLRNNHFSHLPVGGVLDRLSAFVQIDLQENPWECTCAIVPLKRWMELSSTSVVVNEITCDSPSEHAGRLLRSLRDDAVCPAGDGTPPPVAPAPVTLPSVAPATTPAAAAAPRPAPSHAPGPGPPAEVPLSVLILGLLAVFVLSVCLGAGLLVFVLKRRKAVEAAPPGAGLDLSSFRAHYGEGKRGARAHNYIPAAVGHMCPNPIYAQKEADPPAAYYRNLAELGLYQNVPGRAGTGEHRPGYDLCTLPKGHAYGDRGDRERLNRTLLYGTPRKRSEQLLPGKLKAEPDYLEVLEKHTAASQL